VPKIPNRLLYLLPIVILIIAVLVVAIISGQDSTTETNKTAAKTQSCGAYRDDRNVIIDHKTIKAEIPNSPTAYEKGLAGRPCILPDQGMLFIFTRDSQYPIWMKGMKFPIDIVWITSQKTVAAIEINEKPSTYPDKFVNRIPARYVLELKANRSRQLHMSLGTPVSF
jgi:uncharacterized membrane protein (UPF0127 family)